MSMFFFVPAVGLFMPALIQPRRWRRTRVRCHPRRMAPRGRKLADPGDGDAILVNRAPVLTLWAAIVAERLGHEPDAALTLGRALAGLNAQTKGRRLGIFEAPAPGKPGRKKPAQPAAAKAAAGRPLAVELMGRSIPAVRTRDGVRALERDRAADPAAVQRYLEGKFGAALPAARAALEELARSVPRADLAESAFALYERFRPSVPAGQRGWGAKGVLDLGSVRALARR